jgi:peptide/histidine transporter 3/4
MLTISSMLQAPQTHSARLPSSSSLAFFYVALYLLALAQGFHRPCVEALGADQFAPSDGSPSVAASRSSYFNWFHFSISWGYAVATAGLSYVEDNVGWTVGFAACWATMALYLAVFLLGTPTYRAENTIGVRSFTKTVRSWAARVFRHNGATDAER